MWLVKTVGQVLGLNLCGICMSPLCFCAPTKKYFKFKFKCCYIITVKMYNIITINKSCCEKRKLNDSPSSVVNKKKNTISKLGTIFLLFINFQKAKKHVFFFNYPHGWDLMLVRCHMNPSIPFELVNETPSIKRISLFNQFIPLLDFFSSLLLSETCAISL